MTRDLKLWLGTLDVRLNQACMIIIHPLAVDVFWIYSYRKPENENNRLFCGAVILIASPRDYEK